MSDKNNPQGTHISVSVMFDDADGHLASFARNAHMSIDDAIAFLESVKDKVTKAQAK